MQELCIVNQEHHFRVWTSAYEGKLDDPLPFPVKASFARWTWGLNFSNTLSDIALQIEGNYFSHNSGSMFSSPTMDLVCGI